MLNSRIFISFCVVCWILALCTSEGQKETVNMNLVRVETTSTILLNLFRNSKLHYNHFASPFPSGLSKITVNKQLAITQRPANSYYAQAAISLAQAIKSIIFLKQFLEAKCSNKCKALESFICVYSVKTVSDIWGIHFINGYSWRSLH